MDVLIIKLGAAGDVVRTTPLLRVSGWNITWLTERENLPLISQCRSVPFNLRKKVTKRRYDLVINLEDSFEAASFCDSLSATNIFGAYLDGDKLSYTENSAEWFDMSLISKLGIESANQKKFQNRKSYQEIIFQALGIEFKAQKYVLPDIKESPLSGDIAISVRCGKVWPTKNWPYYYELKNLLLRKGYSVNVLPLRISLLDHMADIAKHKLLVSGDSLPMHIALGLGLKCVTLFTCTSPWEIYDYGLQQKVISPWLERSFYRRTYDAAVAGSILVTEVLDPITSLLPAH